MIGPVFVVGCFRSGTTVLEKVLRRHPQLGGLGFETCAFTHLAHGRRLPSYNAERWHPILERHLGTRSWQEVAEPLEVFDEVMSATAEAQGARGWVEKTPQHLFHVPAMLARYPTARVVLAVRDGRDVATSIAATSYLLPRVRRRSARLLAAAVLWQWSLQEAARLLSTPAAQRISVVRYEDLVDAPEAVLAGLARALELPADGWAEALGDLPSNSAFGRWTGLSARPVGRWLDRRLLDAGEAARLQCILAPTLRPLGYLATDGCEPSGELGLQLRGRLGAHVLGRWTRHLAAPGRSRPGPLAPVCTALVGRGASRLPAPLDVLDVNAASSGG